MMKVQFSQAWAKQKYEEPLREAIHFVKGSRSCSDLLVKVFFYKERGSYRGNYRNVRIHGSYGTDRGMANIITLKFSDRIFHDPSVLTIEEQEQLELRPATHGRMYRLKTLELLKEEFIALFAHEFKHYLDMKNLESKHKYRHWEVRAEKFAERKMLEWSMKCGENQ